MYFYVPCCGWSSHFGHISLTSGKNPIESPLWCSIKYTYSAHFFVYCWFAPHSQALSKLVCKWFKCAIKHLEKTIIIEHIAYVIDFGVLKVVLWKIGIETTHTLNKITTNARQVFQTQFTFINSTFAYASVQLLFTC